MSMCRVVVAGKGCLLWTVGSLDKTLLAFALLPFGPARPNLPVTPGISWLPTFAFQSPMMKRTSFSGGGSRRSYRSSENQSTSASLASVVGTQTWITVLLNGLPGKRTNIILLFLRLHQGLHFRLLLTVRATPFLLRDSCPHSRYNGHLN